MRKSSRKGLPAAGLACLLLALFPWHAGAQEPSAPSDSLTAKTDSGQAQAAAQAWRLGISPFYSVHPDELALTGAGEFDLSMARDLARKASKNALTYSLPAMLIADLEPLPNRSHSSNAGKGGGDEVSFVPVALSPSISEGTFIDIGNDDDLFSANEGLIAGFYSRESETIRCVMLFFEKGSPKPIGSVSFAETIDTLENMKTKVLPGILSWVANQPVGILDVNVAPAGGSSTFVIQPADAEGAVASSGTRAFVYKSGNYEIAVSRKGYEMGNLPISALVVGAYRSAKIELVPAINAASTQSSFAAAAESLKMLEVNAYHGKEKKFHSALGRFVLGVPVTAIALGAFFSYWEAYSRSAASVGALSISGGAAALCVSIEIGFIIDTAIKLVDVLHASR